MDPLMVYLHYHKGILVAVEAAMIRVARFKRFEKAKFGQKQYQRRPNSQKLKKGKIFFKNMLK